MALQMAVHPAATRTYRETENEHPTLPGNMQRDSFAALVERVAPRLPDRRGGEDRGAERPFPRGPAGR